MQWLLQLVCFCCSAFWVYGWRYFRVRRYILVQSYDKTNRRKIRLVGQLTWTVPCIIKHAILITKFSLYNPALHKLSFTSLLILLCKKKNLTLREKNLLKDKTGCLKKWLSIFYLTTCICVVLVRFSERKRQCDGIINWIWLVLKERFRVLNRPCRRFSNTIE